MLTLKKYGESIYIYKTMLQPTVDLFYYAYTIRSFIQGKISQAGLCKERKPKRPNPEGKQPKPEMNA